MYSHCRSRSVVREAGRMFVIAMGCTGAIATIVYEYKRVSFYVHDVLYVDMCMYACMKRLVRNEIRT
jgi:hypothetical protein